MKITFKRELKKKKKELLEEIEREIDYYPIDGNPSFDLIRGSKLRKIIERIL